MYAKTVFPQKDALSTLIVMVLARHYPLSKMKLYHKIKADYKKNITYQAVSKAVGQLAAEHILLKQGKEYLLDEEWITCLEKFSNELVANYGSKHSKLVDKNTTEITFYTAKEVGDFLFNNLNTDFFDIGKGKKIGFQMKNITFAPLSHKQLSQLRKLSKENKVYLTVAYDFFMNRAIAKLLRLLGIKVKLGVDCSHNSVIIVTENCLVNLYVPDEMRKEEFSMYKIVKSLADLRLISFYANILNRPMKFHMTITRNKELAAKVLNETIEMCNS